MKAIRKAYKAVLVIAVLAVSGKAMATEGGPMIELKKTYSKSYSLGSNEKVSINHQYGELTIHTWDKNEVKAEVTISVSSDDEQYARSVLNAISIEDGKNSNGVYFRTQIGDVSRRRNNGSRSSENRVISYVVYMPSPNPLYVNMQFGSTNISDFRGPIEISHEYGSLTTGMLSNVKSISATYGSASLGGINNGKVNLEYGSASIRNISGNVQVYSGYCQIKVGVDNDIKSLDLKCEYGDVQMNVADNINASFNVKTSYAELKNRGGIKFTKEKEDSGPVFDHIYTATNGNGSAKIKVKSEFTQVTIGNNLSLENNSKSKKKEKSI